MMEGRIDESSGMAVLFTTDGICTNAIEALLAPGSFAGGCPGNCLFFFFDSVSSVSGHHFCFKRHYNFAKKAVSIPLFVPFS